MKGINIILFLCLLLAFFTLEAQDAAVKIDGKQVYLKAGSSLPYWLNAGQTIAPSKNVSFLSGIQFSSDSATHVLKYDQVIKISGSSTVPAAKAWKIEAIAYDTLITPTNTNAIQLPANGGVGMSNGSTSSTANTPVLYKSPKVFDVPGTYQWVVPPGVTSICVEIWGGGGNGATASYQIAAAGGGAGGYGYQCFVVTPNTSYTLIVGGVGQTSSFGTVLVASPGANAQAGLTAGGLGGTCNASFSVNGENGADSYTGGKGGSAYNGGRGGNAFGNGGCGYGNPGNFPGGGGSSGGANNWNCANVLGGAGASGQVIIYW